MVTAPELREWVREEFAVDLVALQPVGHGADQAAELWRGVATDGRAYAVKLSAGGTAAGLALTAHLARRGVRGVAAPLTSREGRLWTEREGCRLSVVPWVSDTRALAGGTTAAHWTAYGRLLAAVHASEIAAEAASMLPREEHTHEHVRAALTSLETALRSPADAQARTFVAEWHRDAAGARVSELLEHADLLGRRLRDRRATAVICHGDPHLGNLLVGDGDDVWLVDWDDAVLAPPERDLMFVLGGVLAFAPVTPEQQSWFFDGYGEADLDADRLAYYRCVRALEDVVDPATWVLDATRSEPERQQAREIVRGVLSPTGLVQLALSGVDAGPVAPRLDRTDHGGHVGPAVP